MFNAILPVLEIIISAVQEKKSDIAKAAGVSGSVVEKVGKAISVHLEKDERLLVKAAEEMEKARQHDIVTQVKDIPLVNLVRGLVRPVITFVAMGWYVYARMENIPLQQEDYAIVGGVLAFWFGLRSFEKRKY